MTSTHADEIRAGERFAFGENWSLFIQSLSEEQVRAASDSLSQMLGSERLAAKSFLDAGSGSGLFSLAARRLGARVHSFDFDPKSVACTASLRDRYFGNDANWTVDEASVLDRDYLRRLGKFDVVYSWGVLHHTGAMWEALEGVVSCAAESGTVCVAIYNDQGWLSRYWLRVKRLYNASAAGRWLTVAVHWPYLVAMRWLVRRLGRRPLERGMRLWRDAVDWLGGYPFEVARPEQLLDWFRARGFELVKLKTCGGRMGCNEYVFRRAGARQVSAL